MTELFDKLEFTAPVHVVGYSMGGVIAIDFAAHHSERFESLTLIAPAGIRLVNSVDTPFVKVLKSPVIGHWLWRIVARGFYYPDDGETVVNDDAASKEKLQGNPALQADYDGYFAAMRQIFRFLPLSGKDDLLLKINATSLPITAIFGAADDTVDIDSAEILQRLIPRARMHIVDGGTHHLIIHRWQEIHDHTIAALNSDQAAASRQTMVQVNLADYATIVAKQAPF